jgi:NAD-dependent DNA ligase
MPKPLTGSTIVFSGFTDDALKARLVNVGAIVMASVSGNTDIVIAHDLPAHWSRCVAQPKAVAIAKKKGITLYDIITFRKLYFGPRIRHT